MGDMSYEHLYISAYMRRGPDEMRINCLVKDSPYLVSFRAANYNVLRPGRILLNMYDIRILLRLKTRPTKTTLRKFSIIRFC